MGQDRLGCNVCPLLLLFGSTVRLDWDGWLLGSEATLLSFWSLALASSIFSITKHMYADLNRFGASGHWEIIQKISWSLFSSGGNIIASLSSSLALAAS